MDRQKRFHRFEFERNSSGHYYIDTMFFFHI